MSNSRNRVAIVAADTSRSPYAQLKPVPLTSVKLLDGFWRVRWQTNLKVTLPTQYRLLEETGHFDNFRRASGKLASAHQGRVSSDSDVYKWLEAASWALATEAAPDLRSLVDAVITEIADAQQPDGYLNSYYAGERAGARWSNLRDQHELYCAGHLFQAAVAHYRATDETRLLDVAQRFADLICDTFGAGDSQVPGVPGHPGIEMALVELARATGEARYLAQARYFLDARGYGLAGGQVYHLDHQPFRALKRLVGHAVRALYLGAGAADVYAEAGDPDLGETLARLWEYMVTRQMYISGGVGARYQGEAFGEDYELPNSRAYAETCAAIGVVLWSWRMLQLQGDAAYADMVERVLYNAVLPGISLEGEAYFYQNPLQSNGAHGRALWFDCACCPPNVARVLASLPGYLYSVSDDTVWVHTYTANEAHIALPDGRVVGLIQRTRYPWDGNITIDVLSEGSFSLKVRIPGWCEDRGAVVLVNAEPSTLRARPGTYVNVRRHWQVGDTICLRLSMPARRVQAHPYALENVGRVALMRGPLLYCLEAADNAFGDLRDVVLPPDSALAEEFQSNVLGGVVLLHTQAELVPPGSEWPGRLYRTARPAMDEAHSYGVHKNGARSVNLLAIPYYAWANREPGAMQVWLREKAEAQSN